MGFAAPQWKIMTVGRGAACKVFATIDRVCGVYHYVCCFIKKANNQNRFIVS